MLAAAEFTATIFHASTILADGTMKMLQLGQYHAKFQDLPTAYQDAG